MINEAESQRDFDKLDDLCRTYVATIHAIWERIDDNLKEELLRILPDSVPIIKRDVHRFDFKVAFEETDGHAKVRIVLHDLFGELRE